MHWFFKSVFAIALLTVSVSVSAKDLILNCSDELRVNYSRSSVSLAGVPRTIEIANLDHAEGRFDIQLLPSTGISVSAMLKQAALTKDIVCFALGRTVSEQQLLCEQTGNAWVCDARCGTQLTHTDPGC